jgi:type IV secretory pathway VirB2 component (pilin)
MLTLRAIVTVRVPHLSPAVVRLLLLAVALVLVASAPAAAQTTSIERLAEKVLTVFQGPMLRALCGIGITIGGLMFLFGDHGAKRYMAGALVGACIALGAMQYVAWIP